MGRMTGQMNGRKKLHEKRPRKRPLLYVIVLLDSGTGLCKNKLSHTPNSLTQLLEFMSKVMKTQHQNPELKQG